MNGQVRMAQELGLAPTEVRMLKELARNKARREFERED